LSLDFAIYENAQLKTDNAELRAKYEDVVVQCEHLISENEQLRAYKEYLTEIDLMAVLCEQGQLGVREIFLEAEWHYEFD